MALGLPPFVLVSESVALVATASVSSQKEVKR